MVKIESIEQTTSWRRVLNAARRTVGKDALEKDPSSEWKKKILMAEHSPIRLLEFDFSWKGIKSWVATHFARHHEGCEKFVRSQRDDRNSNELSRDELPQGTLVDMNMTCNAQALINISRKRLCKQASPETRQAWKLVKEEVEKINPEVASMMVPECIYRGGWCPEMTTCGWYKTPSAQKMLHEYHSIYPSRSYVPTYEN